MYCPSTIPELRQALVDTIADINRNQQNVLLKAFDNFLVSLFLTHVNV